MAVLPSNKGHSWAIINIDNDVCIIEDPGLPSEVVHWRYDGTVVSDTLRTRIEVQQSKRLTDDQKFECFFWMGYFYAHLTSLAVLSTKR
jgi:hypothetical protein